MNFCSDCAGSISLRVPQGDTHARFVCDRCGAIHYQNPKIIVGALVTHEDKVLLCRRAIEPRLGFWTLPAGFMENAETTSQGAIRETWEEAGARVELGPMFTLVNVPHVSQVHLFYQARLLGGFEAGEESLEVALFAEDEVPWGEIAFRTVSVTLEHYFEDRRRGVFSFRTIDLDRPNHC